MKFSIITIVRNDKENIEKTILSVLNQKVTLEYIIIDGCSTDGTLKIIEQYKNKIDVLISEPDDGIVDAFNKGLKLATGEIIGITNSGDFLEKNALHHVSDTFDDETEIAYGDVQYWKNNVKDYQYKADHRYLDKFMSINHPSVFVKKSVYHRYGFFDKQYPLAMDYELMLRFYRNGVHFKYINHVLSNMSLGGVSDINWKKAYREAYIIRKKYFGCSLSLYLNYLLQYNKRHISNIVSRLGLGIIKNYYREKFSLIKKYK